MFPHLSKFNLQQWIEADKENWGRRRTVWQDSDFITVVHRGPMRGKQFHINEGDEIYYQLEGELNFHYLNFSAKREILVLKPGEMFLLPANVPHSPRRKKGRGLWSSNASGGLTKWIDGFGFVRNATTSSMRRRREQAKHKRSRSGLPLPHQLCYHPAWYRLYGWNSRQQCII
jgi:mannose-6-phosphate isomerase-like protein (cupin superfamily)